MPWRETDVHSAMDPLSVAMCFTCSKMDAKPVQYITFFNFWQGFFVVDNFANCRLFRGVLHLPGGVIQFGCILVSRWLSSSWEEEVPPQGQRSFAEPILIRLDSSVSRERATSPSEGEDKTCNNFPKSYGTNFNRSFDHNDGGGAGDFVFEF